MKYMKADQVFPEALLKEIQKYVQGEMVYIPNTNGSRKPWGENSGSRAYLNERNERIRRAYREGRSFDELTTEFCLSFDSIKRIVYSKKCYDDTCEQSISWAISGLICLIGDADAS